MEEKINIVFPDFMHFSENKIAFRIEHFVFQLKKKKKLILI